ncbi:MAG: polysaccharide deacetylase family protein [Alphaproteobacteria bacterium]|nr:polysaccharide deacetylase family protein [Alphaproteobacteria bacterium]MBV9370146.1 polysaccharide deacetylase family protein [Alphaproteobacteria bacterium]MBV9901486.1 polysaccharide deacetylase family protein [Alphaproteobacteria bacterium]
MRPLLALLALPAAFGVPSDAGAAPRLELAITMDDLPAHGDLPAGETRLSVVRSLLAAFKAAGVPEVYGFVNGALVEQDPALERVLAAWREAGYPLANHGWSHARLDSLPLGQEEAEVARNEPLLARMNGTADWRWFRYPYLAEGDDPGRRAAMRSILARRSYRIAQVTMSYWDYEYDEAYRRCRDKGDEGGTAELERLFLHSVEQGIEYWLSLSRAVHGRDMRFVLLTHVSAINARMMPRVLALYRRAGFRFVTLAHAERDPAYAADLDPSRPPALDLERAPRALPVVPRYEPAERLEGLCR